MNPAELLLLSIVASHSCTVGVSIQQQTGHHISLHCQTKLQLQYTAARTNAIASLGLPEPAVMGIFAGAFPSNPLQKSIV